MITILFFASFREQLDTESEQMEMQGLTDVGSVISMLRGRGDVWGRVFAEGQTVMVAVNQEMTEESAAIKDGDEIAFFPPVTGG
ncbi:MAG: molybdopterin converting factor subunit 1 [Pseudomonadota bacterium]